MGQQQLLLLVLGIVIVGLAVVVGISAFSENRIKSNADAIVTDGLRIASDAQAWKLKPGQFGGALSTEDLDDVTFDEIGYPNSAGVYSNVDGSFEWTAPTGVTCVAPASVPSGNAIIVTLYGYNLETGNCIAIGIAGTKANDIGTQITYGS